MASQDNEYRTEYTPEEIKEGLQEGREIRVSGQWAQIHHFLHASSIPDGAIGYFRMVLEGSFRELKMTNWSDLTQTYILTHHDEGFVEVTDVELFPDN